MTDAGPRIFRNLESSAGRGNFDTIVRAAVAGFAALARPSAAQARDFGHLVEPLFERTSVETRRIVAASLSVSPRLPRGLVERLIAQPVGVSAPFLLSSPTLTPEDLAALAKRREPGLRKLLKTRNGEIEDAPRKRRATSTDGAAPPSRPSAEAPSTDGPQLGSASISSLAGETGGSPDGNRGVRSQASAMPDRHEPRLGLPASPPQGERSEHPGTEAGHAAPPRLSASRQTELLSVGSLPQELSREPAKLNAADTREELRRLVGIRSSKPKPSLPPKPSPAPAPAPAPAEIDLLALAVAQDAESFYLTLATKLALDRAELARIEADASGADLAVALKATGASSVDALTMLMMLKPAIGTDVAAFEAMERSYGALSVEDCATRFRRRGGGAAHEPLHAETARQIRTEPRRATFGRRNAVLGADARRREPG